MFDVSWWLFVFASLVLIVTPRRDMVLVMSRCIAQGAAAGVVTALGVSVGLIDTVCQPEQIAHLK